MSTVELINTALGTVIDPELHKPLPELGMVESVNFTDGVAKINILLTIIGCPMKDRLHSDITKSLANISEVKTVEINFGVMNEEQRNNVKKLIRGGREKFIPFAQPDSLTRVLGIASGKGGVGKSSVTVNLAVAAAARGLKVGILDADVYGHSIPRLMGILDKRPTAIDQTFIPVENYGVKVVSMEMFKPERSDPVAYRGPLLHRVLEQLLSDAFWGDLDLLLLDLPPGTGDVMMDLKDFIEDPKMILVTTPQANAAHIAIKAGYAAKDLNQELIGVVENMSYYEVNGEKHYIFGKNGGKQVADELLVELLAQLPIVPSDNSIYAESDLVGIQYLNLAHKILKLIK